MAAPFLFASKHHQKKIKTRFVQTAKKRKLLIIQELLRADDGTRTRDLLTTNEVRYHLCHISLPQQRYNNKLSLCCQHFFDFFPFFLLFLNCLMKK